jgi:hypothetical protein
MVHTGAKSRFGGRQDGFFNRSYQSPGRNNAPVTLVPPIVVRDELGSGLLVEHCRIPQLTESFYAIVQNRRFPNQLLGDLLTRYPQGR